MEIFQNSCCIGRKVTLFSISNPFKSLTRFIAPQTMLVN